MSSDETPNSGVESPNEVAIPEGMQEAARELSNGPRGAFVVASIAVGLLFIGWLLFYYLLFMPRGAIG